MRARFGVGPGLWKVGSHKRPSGTRQRRRHQAGVTNPLPGCGGRLLAEDVLVEAGPLAEKKVFMLACPWVGVRATTLSSSPHKHGTPESLRAFCAGAQLKRTTLLQPNTGSKNVSTQSLVAGSLG